jgi:hypothetical protein
MDEHEMPDWPPQVSAVGRPEGSFRHGSTGQLFVVKNGQWKRVSPRTQASPQLVIPNDGGGDPPSRI